MEKQNVFGLPHEVTVGTAAEIADAALRSGDFLYVVFRVSDERAYGPFYPPELLARRLRMPCEKCKEICFYDPEHFLPNTTVVCMQCAPTNTMPTHITKELIQDLTGSLGRLLNPGFRSYRR